MFKKIVLGLLAFAVAYSLFVVFTAVRTDAKEDAFIAEVHRITALADALKLEDRETTLSDACVKLPHVDREQLLAYFPAPAEGLISDSDARKRYGTRTLVALGKTADLPLTGRDLRHWIFEFFSDFPMYWDLFFEWAYDPVQHDISDLKYLVVHQLASIDLPRVSSTTYEPGHMTFRSAVIDPKTGAVLCEGKSAIDQEGTVNVAGSGRTKSDAERDMEDSKEDTVRGMFFIKMQSFAMRDVCSLGGESLCTMMFGTYRPP